MFISKKEHKQCCSQERLVLAHFKFSKIIESPYKILLLVTVYTYWREKCRTKEKEKEREGKKPTRNYLPASHITPQLPVLITATSGDLFGKRKKKREKKKSGIFLSDFAKKRLSGHVVRSCLKIPPVIRIRSTVSVWLQKCSQTVPFSLFHWLHTSPQAAYPHKNIVRTEFYTQKRKEA